MLPGAAKPDSLRKSDGADTVEETNQNELGVVTSLSSSAPNTYTYNPSFNIAPFLGDDDEDSPVLWTPRANTKFFVKKLN